MAKYSHEQKLEAVLGVVERGLSAVSAGKIIGAHKGDVQTWVKLYQMHGVEGLLMKKSRENPNLTKILGKI
jgi:transposase-like protein